MAGAACAKAIIDKTGAVAQVTTCMNATILLSQPRAYPTEEMEAEYTAVADHLAAVAAKIEKAVARAAGLGTLDSSGGAA